MAEKISDRTGEQNMQAILLAGGLGTRLRSVVSDRPKPMALIEDKPFMEYVTRELVRSGITEIIFAVGYKGSMVEEYFKDGSDFGFHASYAYEETLLGTAGAIKNAGKFITEDRFYVLNADTFYQIDYTRLAKQQDDQNLDMALVLRQVPDVSRYGKANLDENCVDFGGWSGEKGEWDPKETQTDDFYQELAVCDEKIMESYFENGIIKTEEIGQLIRERKVFPCYFGSALKLKGVEKLIEGLALYAAGLEAGKERDLLAQKSLRYPEIIRETG